MKVTIYVTLNVGLPCYAFHSLMLVCPKCVYRSRVNHQREPEFSLHFSITGILCQVVFSPRFSTYYFRQFPSSTTKNVYHGTTADFCRFTIYHSIFFKTEPLYRCVAYSSVSSMYIMKALIIIGFVWPHRIHNI